MEFLVFYGDGGKIHAGADVRMFANNIDRYAVLKYLMAGVHLDTRIKELSEEMRTVSVMNGERFGGSVEWPLMTEYSVCTPETGIQFSEVNIGIIPGWDGILNVMLRSSKENALYMGTTGDRVNAGDMLSSNLVSYIAPQDSIMDCALELATADSVPVRQKSRLKRFATENGLMQTLSARLDAQRYHKLRVEVIQKRDSMDPKGLSKYIDKRLVELGKPIAPLAVEAVFGLTAKYADLKPDDPFRIWGMAYDEASICCDLVDTVDRKIGVDSILRAKENPLNKIPVYIRK